MLASDATSGWYCHGAASALPSRCPPSRWLRVADSCSICWMVMQSREWRGGAETATPPLPNTARHEEIMDQTSAAMPTCGKSPAGRDKQEGNQRDTPREEN